MATKQTQAKKKGAQPAAEYMILSKRNPVVEDNAQVMSEAMAEDGFIKLRIQPSIYDPKAKRYLGLLGEQIRIKATGPEAIGKIMDAIDKALTAGEVRS